MLAKEMIELFVQPQMVARHLLGPAEILIGASKIGFGSGDFRLRGCDGGLSGTYGGRHSLHLCLRGIETRFSRSDVGVTLNRFELNKKTALAHAVAFLHRQAHNASHHVRADVHVLLRLDLAICRNGLSQILANGPPRLDCDHSAVAHEHAVAHG